jgi:hypothetical protein
VGQHVFSSFEDPKTMSKARSENVLSAGKTHFDYNEPRI